MLLMTDNDKDCMLSWAKRDSFCSEIWRSPIQHTIMLDEAA